MARSAKYCIVLVLFSTAAIAFHSDSIFDPEETPPVLHSRACFEDYSRQCEPNQRFVPGYITSPILAGKDEARASYVTGTSTVNAYIVLGHAHDGSSLRGAVARYKYDGGLDTSFSTTGKLTFDASAADDLIHGYGNGTVPATTLFAGRAGGPSDVNWMIGRIRAATSLDTSFWTTGYRVGSLYPGNDEIFRAVNQRQSDVATGYVWRDGRYNFAIAAFATDGALDTSFNTEGFNLTMMSNWDNGALAISSLYSAAYLVGGPVYNGTNWDFGLARYTVSGALDTTFSTDGMSTFGVLSSNDKLYGLSLWESRAYPATAVGYAYNGTNNDFAVAKVRSDGRLDTTFNTSGMVTTAIGAGDDVAFAVSGMVTGAQNNYDGKVLAVGSTDNAGNINIAMVRYRSNGTLDTSFHTDGIATYDIYGQRDVANSIGVGTNGDGGPMHYSVGAQVTNGADQDFALLLVETDGSLVQGGGGRSLSFGTSGDGTVLQNVSGNDVVTTLPSIAWLSGQNQTLWGVGYTGSDILISRFRDYGTLDTAFNTTSAKTIDLGGTEQIVHGTTLANNTVFLGVGNNGSDFLIARLSTAGDLTTTFNTLGYETIDFSGSDLATFIHTGSGFIVGKDGGTPSKFAAVFLDTSTGALNTSFNTNGKATFAPTGNAAQAKFALVGNSNMFFIAGDDGQDFAVVGVKSDGTLSTTFNTNGIATVDFGGTETMGGGEYNRESGSYRRIFLAGGNGNDFCIARVTTGGNIDTTFNTTGKLTVDFGTVGEKAKAVFNDGYKTVIVGDDGTNFLFLKLLMDGTLDTSFNTTGKKAFALTGASTAYSISKKYHKYCATGSSNGNTDAVTLCINP